METKLRRKKKSRKVHLKVLRPKRKKQKNKVFSSHTDRFLTKNRPKECSRLFYDVWKALLFKEKARFIILLTAWMFAVYSSLGNEQYRKVAFKRISRSNC